MGGQARHKMTLWCPPPRWGGILRAMERDMSWPYVFTDFFIEPRDPGFASYRWWRGANDRMRPTSGKNRSKIKAARKQSRKDRRK